MPLPTAAPTRWLIHRHPSPLWAPETSFPYALLLQPTEGDSSPLLPDSGGLSIPRLFTSAHPSLSHPLMKLSQFERSRVDSISCRDSDWYASIRTPHSTGEEGGSAIRGHQPKAAGMAKSRTQVCLLSMSLLRSFLQRPT